jgi:hypothetical protein
VQILDSHSVAVLHCIKNCCNKRDIFPKETSITTHCLTSSGAKVAFTLEIYKAAVLLLFMAGKGIIQQSDGLWWYGFYSKFYENLVFD